MFVITSCLSWAPTPNVALIKNWIEITFRMDISTSLPLVVFFIPFHSIQMAVLFLPVCHDNKDVTVEKVPRLSSHQIGLARIKWKINIVKTRFKEKIVHTINIQYSSSRLHRACLFAFRKHQLKPKSLMRPKLKRVNINCSVLSL